MGPICPHVCSMFARAHGPSTGGLVKNGPARHRYDGMRPRNRAVPPAGPAPAPLDQWSRPSRRALGASPEFPMPVASRSVRPAGSRHSRGDTPLMPRARHARYPPGMRGAAARCPRAVVPEAVFARSGKSAGHTSVCTRFRARLPSAPRSRRQHAAGYWRARQAGARAATAGPDARGRRDSRQGDGRARTGLCAPGTARGRAPRATGCRGDAGEERAGTGSGAAACYRSRQRAAV
jgi:hypothetical protein